MNVRVCVTGGLACGKSLVGSLLEQMQVPVLDTDRVGHELLARSQPVIRRVKAQFGPRIVGPDGAVDRGRLGRRVFADATQRQALNRILHPRIRKIVAAWVRDEGPGPGARRNGVRVVLVPLVFEVGWEKDWDCLVCVGAPDPVQRARLKQRGLSDSEIRARMGAQLPVEEKMRRADYVIFNAGTVDALHRQVKDVYRQIKSLMEMNDGRKK